MRAPPLSIRRKTVHPEQLFELLAATTWRTIERASGRQIIYGEDAITSVNLLILSEGGNGTYAVEDVRVDEAKKGCDFELWIGSAADGWRRFAVQAKKVQLSTGAYSKLGYRTGGALQLDVLESYARANRARPLYCLYNFSLVPGAWHCGLPNEQRQLGCSVASSSAVRIALGQRGGKSFSAVHAHKDTLPWRCLVRCGSVSAAACSGGGVRSDPDWPNEYDRLPVQLSRFMLNGGDASVRDLGGLFSYDCDYRPRWVAVIDLGVDKLPPKHQFD